MDFPTIPSGPGVVIDHQMTAWAGRFAAMHVVTFRNQRFDGAMSVPHQWELCRRRRAAALLPYDPWTDQVVLIEQFRLPALAAGFDPVMTEVPAGLCETGETPEATIIREAEEETGVRPDRLLPMLDILLTPGGSDERCTLFAGRVHAPAAGTGGVVGRAGVAAENEDIRVLVLPAPVAIENAVAGLYPNSVAVMALLWLGARRDHLRATWQ